MTLERPAHFAGSWYPASAQALRQLFEQADSAVRQQASVTAWPCDPLERPVAALLPHAGLRYSARAQLAGLQGLEGWRNQAPRIILLAPSHYLPLDADHLYYSDATRYETPFGPLAAWTAPGLETLADRNRLAIDREHALELLFPVLAWLLPEAGILPLLVPALSGPASLERLGQMLVRLVETAQAGGQPCLVLASSDLTHYGERFDHVPFGRQVDARVLAEVRTRDLAACDLVAAGNAAELLDQRDRLAPTMCGRHAAMLLAHLASWLAYRGQTVAWYHSLAAETTANDQWPVIDESRLPPGADDGFVSYAAIRFTATGTGASPTGRDSGGLS